MSDRVTMLDALPIARRRAFLERAHEATFPQGWRIFDEGRYADRFWIVKSGAVALDMPMPGRQVVAVETLGPGELLGWSWLFPPYRWHLSARALGAVVAYEFNAAEIRDVCRDDPVFGRDVVLAVAGTIAHRLNTSRARLVDLYGPRLREHS